MPTEYILPNQGPTERTRRVFQHEQPFLHVGSSKNQILYTHRNERGVVITSVLTVHSDGRLSNESGTYASVHEFARLKGVLPLDMD